MDGMVTEADTSDSKSRNKFRVEPGRDNERPAGHGSVHPAIGGPEPAGGGPGPAGGGPPWAFEGEVWLAFAWVRLADELLGRSHRRSFLCWLRLSLQHLTWSAQQTAIQDILNPEWFQHQFI